MLVGLIHRCLVQPELRCDLRMLGAQMPIIFPCPPCRAALTNKRMLRDHQPVLHFSDQQGNSDFSVCVHFWKSSARAHMSRFGGKIGARLTDAKGLGSRATRLRPPNHWPRKSANSGLLSMSSGQNCNPSLLHDLAVVGRGPGTDRFHHPDYPDCHVRLPGRIAAFLLPFEFLSGRLQRRTQLQVNVPSPELVR
jgi:hypothetical protein